MKHLNSRLFALEETQNKANQGVFYARKKKGLNGGILRHGKEE